MRVIPALTPFLWPPSRKSRLFTCLGLGQETAAFQSRSIRNDPSLSFLCAEASLVADLHDRPNPRRDIELPPVRFESVRSYSVRKSHLPTGHEELVSKWMKEFRPPRTPNKHSLTRSATSNLAQFSSELF